MELYDNYENPRYLQLVADVTDYEETGVISDLMVTYFDQNGDLLHEREFPRKSDPKTQRILKSIRIPEDHLISTDETGMVTLHSSCCITDQRRPTQVKLHRICGDFRTLRSDHVVAPNLTEIGGMLDANGGTIELPALQHVGFLAHAETARKFDPESGWRRYLNLPELLTAGTIIPDVHFLDLPKLETVSDDFESFPSKRINAPNLRFVGGKLSITHCEVNFPEDIKARSLYMSPDSLKQWKDWVQRQKVRKALRGNNEGFEISLSPPASPPEPAEPWKFPCW